MDLISLLFLFLIAGGLYVFTGGESRRAAFLSRVSGFLTKLQGLAQRLFARSKELNSKFDPVAQNMATKVAASRVGGFLGAGIGRWIALASIIAIVVAGGVVGAVREAALEEAAKTHADELHAIAFDIAEQDEIRRLEALDVSTLAEVSLVVSAGESRLAESEEYGDADARVLLEEAIVALQAVIDSVATIERQPGQISAELEEAAASVNSNIDLVGTREEALSAAYLELAEKLDVYAPSVENGIAYCEAVDASFGKKSTRKIAIEMWEGISLDENSWEYWDESELDGEAEVAVKVVCPKYKSAWKLASRIFGDGNYIVGKDIKPGRYETIDGVNNCYWERNTGSGRIIDNYFGSAYKGVTVSLGRGEGFETSRCGAWIPR